MWQQHHNWEMANSQHHINNSLLKHYAFIYLPCSAILCPIQFFHQQSERIVVFAGWNFSNVCHLYMLEDQANLDRGFTCCVTRNCWWTWVYRQIFIEEFFQIFPQSHWLWDDKRHQICVCLFTSMNWRIGHASIESRQFYIHIERFNNSLATIFLYMAVFMTATLFSSTALMPICYRLFGFPEPNHWLLPIPVM